MAVLNALIEEVSELGKGHCFLFFLGFIYLGLSADDNSPIPDISGIYETEYPGEEWDNVIIGFTSSFSEIEYKGKSYPSYKVSLWEKNESNIRKLRDGIFDTYTIAGIYPYKQDYALFWYSTDRKNFRFNKIIEIDSARNISLGSQNINDNDNRSYNYLRYLGETDFIMDELKNDVNLEGIYDYYHRSTGHVIVRFKKLNDSINVEWGKKIAGYSVTVLSSFFGYCYTIVTAGLYGGSLKNDSYPLAGIQIIDNEYWIIWFNPEKPGHFRKNRIVSLYSNGNIGIGLNKGEMKYLEDTVFRRISDCDVRIAGNGNFIQLEGFYYIKQYGSTTEILIYISPTHFITGLGLDEAMIYKITSVDNDNGIVTGLHEGLFPGDSFTHISLYYEENKYYLKLYSFSMQIMEENEIINFNANGDFTLGSELAGKRIPLFKFRKIDSLLSGN